MPKPSRDPDAPTELPAEEQDAILDALPDDVPDLGPVVRVGQRYGKLSDSPLLAAVAAGVAFILPVVVGVVVALNPPAERNEQYAAIGLIAIPTVAGLVAAGYGLFLLLTPRYRRGELWFFFRDGLVRSRWGRKVDIFPWDGLQVRKTRANPISRQYELSNRHGDTVKLGFSMVGGQLVQDIQDHQVKAVRPALLRAVADGEVVKFGRLSVGKDGLHLKKSVLPWDDVAKLDFMSDPKKNWDVTLAVESRHLDEPWATLKVGADLPNAWLFLQLIAKLEPRLVPKGKGKDNLRGWLA